MVHWWEARQSFLEFAMNILSDIAERGGCLEVKKLAL